MPWFRCPQPSPFQSAAQLLLVAVPSWAPLVPARWSSPRCNPQPHRRQQLLQMTPSWLYLEMRQHRSSRWRHNKPLPQRIRLLRYWMQLALRLLALVLLLAQLHLLQTPLQRQPLTTLGLHLRPLLQHQVGTDK